MQHRLATRNMMASMYMHTLKEVKSYYAKDGQQSIRRYFLSIECDLNSSSFTQPSTHTTVIVKVKIVSCHPGWTLTDGVKAAYGDKRSSLEVRYGQSIFSRPQRLGALSISSVTRLIDIVFSSSQPMRSLWQGAEGITWLCLVDSKDLKSGEFYLDRSTQPKHMSGTRHA